MRKKVNQKILIYKNDDNLNSELFNIKNAKSIIEECQNLDKVFDLGENGFFSKIDPLLKSIK